jgi:integral membrane sensor domain MASE1
MDSTGTTQQIGSSAGSVRGWLPTVRTAVGALLVAAAYYIGGLVGLALRFPPLGISSIWPPNALLLAALLLTPVRAWWVYVLAALPIHLHLVAHFQPGVPLVTMLCQFTGNAVQAVVAALTVRHFIGVPPQLDTLRRMAVFILLAAIAAPAVASTLAASLFILTGWTADFWLAWRQRFLTNVFVTLTIPPLILVTVTGGTAPWRNAPAWRYVEFGLLVVGLLAVGLPVFGLEAAGPGSFPALLYAPLPPLLWAAIRFELGGVCLSLLLVALLSLANEKNSAALGPTVGGQQTLAGYLKTHLTRLGVGDYFALLAYIAMNETHERLLQAIRLAVRDARHVATCLGFGPRFLHSTGQAYKGGPNTGVFLQITCDDAVELPVPGQKYTFGVVKAAQARGDFQVLAERDRRVLRAHLGPDVAAGLATLQAAIAEALAS